MSPPQGSPQLAALPNYRPRFPADRKSLGIAILGFGGVAKKWHVTAYRKYGLRLTGAYDSSSEVVAEARKSHPELRLYASLEELLNDPDVAIVDIATRPSHRLDLISRVLAAGKHVLAQKPLTPGLAGLSETLALARSQNLKVAVNQNGRWAPPWRLATLLIEAGAIGDVIAVTHMFDTRLRWILDPARHGSTHFLLFDYACHWIDITRCWLAAKELSSVQARDPKAPIVDGEMMSQGAWIAMDYSDGSTAVIRGVACGADHRGHPFWIHGTEGTLRGDVDSRAGDYLEMERRRVRNRFELEGEWFPDGFAGTMGELMCAIDEDREPFNSLAHNELTVRASLAACYSAEHHAIAVEPRNLGTQQEGLRS